MAGICIFRIAMDIKKRWKDKLVDVLVVVSYYM